MSARHASDPPAIVLQASGPNALGIIRSLARAGVRVIACDHDPRALGLLSRYATPVRDGRPAHRARALPRRPDGARRAREGGGVLFPTHDEAIATIGPHEAEIDAVVRRPWSPWATMSAIIDKGHQHEVARRIGFPVPATVTPDDEADIVALSRDLRFPVILKPRYSPEFRRRFRAQVLEAADPEELRRQWELAAEYRPQLSEVIPGGDSQLWTLGSYRDDAGRPLASFTGRKLRQWPPRFGTARAAEGRWDPDYAARGHALLDALGFHGISQVETKRDLRDGRDYLIEVNPRSWLWIGPRHQLRRQPALRRPGATRSGSPRAWPPGHRSGVRWILATKHLAGSVREIRRGRVDGAARSPRRCARRWSTASSTRATRARRSPSTAARCAHWGRGVAELRIRIEGVRPALRAARPLGAGDPRRGARRGAGASSTARPTSSTRPSGPPRASGSPPTPPRRPSSRATGGRSRPPPCTAAAGLTLLFAPTHAGRPDPRRPRGERLLPAGALGRAARRPSATASTGCRSRRAPSGAIAGLDLEDPAGRGLHRGPAARAAAARARPGGASR